MNSNNETQVFPEVVFWNNQEWKRFPDSPNAYVSRTGVVMEAKIDRTYKLASVTFWETSKGSYAYAAVINWDFIRKSRAIHQIVALTYLGRPPANGKRYEPNHIDGDKHNNHVDNLEWMTRSENVQHAFDTGLCTVGVRVKVKNCLTGLVHEYNTLSRLAREWGIPRWKLMQIMADHRTTPYEGEFLFEVDRSSDEKLDRHQTKSIVYKDYVSGVITIVKSATRAADETGIPPLTISSRLRVGKNKVALLSRYVFQEMGKVVPWPEYTVAEALTAEQVFNSKPVIRLTGKHIVKDYLTEEITEHKNFSQMFVHISKTRTLTIKSKDVFAGKAGVLVQGFVFFEKEEVTDWPEFTKEEIAASSYGRKIFYKVTDITDNTIKVFNSQTELVSDMSIHYSSLLKYPNSGIPFRGRFIIESSREGFPSESVAAG